MRKSKARTLPEGLLRIAEARHHEPFSVLGRHEKDGEAELRVFRPGAHAMRVADSDIRLDHVPDSDFFEWRGPAEQLPLLPRLEWLDSENRPHSAYDPYSYPPLVSDWDLHLFGEGNHWHVYRVLGAHARKHNEVPGVLFAVWAPNAQRVSVIGEFNGWDGRVHPLRSRGGSGVWELFIPELPTGSLYKFEIRTHAKNLLVKSDPYDQWFEQRPATASHVCPESVHS
jgi:1,4-alpha-glucan branching enzyme